MIDAAVHDSAPFTVAFVGAGEKVAGFGVLAGPRHVVTCRSVIDALLGSPADAPSPAGRTVRARFPQSDAPDEIRILTVARWDPVSDLIALTLADDAAPPSGASPAWVPGDPPPPGATVHFRLSAGASTDLVATTVGGRSTPGQIQLDPSPAGRPGVDAGSPVYHRDSGAVVGLLLARPSGTTDPVRKVIAAAEIRRFWPDLLQPVAQPGDVDLLHLSDLRLGDPGQDNDWAAGLLDDIERQAGHTGIQPDLVVVSGDLTSTGDRPQLDRAFDWLDRLAGRLGLDRSSVLVVPGERDVNVDLRDLEFRRAALLGRPAERWGLFAAASARFHRGTGMAPFDPERPWSLVPVPGRRLVVAALNSTIGLDDRPGPDTGEITEAQAGDIRDRLPPYLDRGWLRIGVVHHNPGGFQPGSRLRDAERVTGLLDAGLISLLLHGHAGDRTGGDGLLGAGGPGSRYNLVRVEPDRYRTESRDFEAGGSRWPGDSSTTVRDFRVRPEPVDAPERLATEEFRGRVRRALAVRAPGVPIEETVVLDGSVLRAGERVVRALDGPVTEREIRDAPERATIVHSGPPPGADLVRPARERRVRTSTLVAYQQVTDLSAASAGDRGHVTEHYVPQGFDVAGPDEPPSQNDDLAAEIDAWFAEDRTPPVVVTGPVGSGKSTLLRRLALTLTGTFPLLIDLSESDAGSADTVLVRSLLDLGVTDLRVDRIRYQVAEGRIALLLDGFDHSPLVGELLELVTPYSKMVLAGRDPSLGGAGAPRRTVSLREFTADRVDRYLNLRLGTGIRPWAGTALEALGRNPQSLVRLAGLGPDRLREVAENQVDQLTLHRELAGRESADRRRERTSWALGIARAADGADHGGDPVVDWLLAEAVAERLRTGDDDALLRSVRLTPAAGELLIEIAGARARAWAAGEHPAESIAGHNATIVRDRLDEASPAVAGIDGGLPSDAVREDVLAGRSSGRIQAVVGGEVHCLAYGTGGHLLAVGRGDVVELVDRASAQVIRHLVRHSSTVRGVTFHDGDRFVISGSEDGTVCMWDTATGEHVRDFPAHPRAVTALTVSGPTNLLVTACADGNVRIWDPGTGRAAGPEVLRRRPPVEPFNEVTAIAADPARPIVVAGTQDHRAIGWDIRTGEAVFDRDLQDSVTAVAFAPDGSFVVTTNGGRASHRDGTGAEIESLPTGDTTLTCAAFSSGGDLLAVGRRNGELLLRRGGWQTWTAHAGPITAVTFPAGGQQVTTTGLDGMVKTWSVKTTRLLRELGSDTYWASGLAFHDRGEGRLRLAASTWDGVAIVWNLPDGTTEAVLGKPAGALNGVAFSPDGERVVAGQLLDPPVARLWQLGTGAERELDGHYDGLTGVAFAPDGRFLATVAEDHSFIVWDDDGRLLHRRPVRQRGERSEEVTCLAFRPGQAMLAIGHGLVVRMWNPETGIEFPGLRMEHERTLSAVAFVPFADQIVTATRDNFAWIWNLGEPERHFARLDKHSGSVNCVAVSPDGRWAATGSSDNTVQIYGTSNGEHHHTLAGHAGGVTAVAFAPDGTMLASAARDNTIRLWDLSTQKTVATLHLLRDGASVAVRDDGAYLTHGDVGTGVWWVSGRCRVPLGELRPEGVNPRPLAYGETLLPANPGRP